MHFEGNYLVLDDNDKIYNSKIFSSKYPTLIGCNDFQKPGDALLEMWKLIPKEPFDPFYALRGVIAEKRVLQVLQRKGATFKYFGSESSKQKIFDLFTNNKYFGGVYDFLVKNNDGVLANVEIKATNKKNEPYLKQAKKEHIKQAQLSSFLGNVKRCKIVYVFFDDESESKIREWLSEPYEESEIFDLNCTYKTFEVELNEQEIQKDMLNAFDLVNECKKNRRIPIHLISDNILDKLGYKPNIFERTTIDYD